MTKDLLINNLGLSAYNQLPVGQISDQKSNPESDFVIHVCGDNVLAALAFTVMKGNAQAVIHRGHANII